MKSKTSFSKLMPYRKNLTRFAPVWVLYLIALLMLLPEVMSYGDWGSQGYYLPEVIQSMGVVNLLYAALCALFLFGDLYNTKMCYSLHAMPQRRETWFLSHWAAAFTFSFVPNFLACLLISFTLGSNVWLVWMVLLASLLQFVFFFGVASLSAMLAGSRIAMLLICAGLNFLSVLAYWILDVIYLPMLTGVELDMTAFQLLCPVVQIVLPEYMEFELIRTEFTQNGILVVERTYEFRNLSDGWGYLAILGVLGLVLAAVAVVLYRLRHLESAGDFVAFPKLKWPMALAITLCVGGGFAFLGDWAFGDSLWLWLAVGLVIGWFGGWMLLERQLKIFQVKRLIAFGALAVLLVISFMMTFWDVFGIESWLPESEKVESVTIANYYDGKNSYDYIGGTRIRVTLEEPEQIEEIIEAHQDILNRLDEDTEILTGEGYSIINEHRVVLTYKLHNGRTVVRSYSAPASGKNYEIIQKYFYGTQQLLAYEDWDTFLDEMGKLWINSFEIPWDRRHQVMEAIKADCDAGHITAASNASKEGQWLCISSDNGYYRELYIYPEAEKTFAVLSLPEVVLGYTDWDALIAAICEGQEGYVACSGQMVPQDKIRGLLEAIKADCEAGTLSLFDYGSAYHVEISGPDYQNYLYIPGNAANTITYILENELSS